MEATRRVLRRRKPLSDCSNSSTAFKSGGVSRVKKAEARSCQAATAAALKLVEKGTNLRRRREYGVASGKENVKEIEKEVVAEAICPLLSTPVGKLEAVFSNSAGLPATIYTRTRGAKQVSEPSSCPPAQRKRDIISDDKDNGMLKGHTEPSKKRRCSLNDLILQEFIERQRAYFEEIDKVELPVEEASESEEEPEPTKPLTFNQATCNSASTNA